MLRPGSDPLALSWDFDNQLTGADVDNDSTDDVTYQYDALAAEYSVTTEPRQRYSFKTASKRSPITPRERPRPVRPTTTSTPATSTNP